MFDTIVCYTRVPHLSATLFDGGSFSMAGGRRYARFWWNASDDYKPRVTYWRQPLETDELPVELGDPAADDAGDGVLRVEFSLAKLATDDVERWLMARIPNLPPLRTWTVVRIDYMQEWVVGGEIDIYLSVMKTLNIASARANTYPTGVMWKMSERSVKFYDKDAERGVGRGRLRYEVCNRRQAVAYMCDKWFHCDRTVGELVHVGRAVYVLAYFWQKLGLSSVETYGSETQELLRITSCFGNRAGSALLVLRLHREYGKDCVKRGLVSTTLYYRYKRLLVEHGFLTSTGSEVVGHVPALRLQMSTNEENQVVAQNLKVVKHAHNEGGEKNLREILGVASGAALPPEILRWYERTIAEAE